MEISFLGHSSFKIRGKIATVVTDPYSSEMLGFKFPKVQADIVTVSHDHSDHNQAEKVLGNPKVISAPGEYEIAGVSIFGIATDHDAKGGQERGRNTCYLIEMDNLRICHLGDLGCKLTDSQLGELNGVDILLVPVGGIYTLGPKEASLVISQLEPTIVIPMHFKTSEINLSNFGKLLPVEEFLKEMGIEANFQPKLSVNRESLPQEKVVIVLERRT